MSDNERPHFLRMRDLYKEQGKLQLLALHGLAEPKAVQGIDEKLAALRAEMDAAGFTMDIDDPVQDWAKGRAFAQKIIDERNRVIEAQEGKMGAGI